MRHRPCLLEIFLLEKLGSPSKKEFILEKRWMRKGQKNKKNHVHKNFYGILRAQSTH